MANTLQFLLGLLLATQICCLQNSEFILGNGKKLTVYDTSVKFEKFFVNHTHVESLVRYQVKGTIRGAIGFPVFENLPLVFHTVKSINLDDTNKPLVTKCDISLKTPTTLGRHVFKALEDLIYNTTCINANGFTDLAFDTFVGNNDVQLGTITSTLKNVEQTTRDITSEHDKHQRGIDTAVDMALDFIMKKFEIPNINLSEMVTPRVTVTDLSVGNFTTLTRTRPLKMYRKNDILTVDGTFKIRPNLLFKATGNIFGFSTPTMELNAFAEKIEVGIKLNIDYSVEPCKMELIDMNFTKEKLVIRMMDEGVVAAVFNMVLPYVESLMTPEALLPMIKNELQNILDSEKIRSEAESLRPIFPRF